jgi:membrane fusion protein, multidrug efflux system
MIPIAVAANTARRASRLFFSERTESDYQSSKRFFKPLCWVAVVFFILSTGCKPSTQVPTLPPPPVTVATPIQKEIVEWDEYTGRTAAVESVKIRPRVSGYVDQISFQDGQLVKPGAVLFVIDPSPYQAALEIAKANLENAEAQRELRQANYARAEKLFQTKVTSKEEYDTSVAEKNQAIAQAGQASAQLNLAQLNLNWTQVKSPIEGRISRQLVTKGNLVQADTTELTTIVSFDPIYAYFSVDERTVQKYYNEIQSGQLKDPRATFMPVYLQLEGETGFPHEGVIDFVNNTYNASTGTLQIRGRFANEDAALYPDAFVRIRIAGTPKYKAILISDRAVGSDQGQKFVLLVDDNSVVQVRPVELGPVVDGLRVVRKGVELGDRVIINGLVNARPGSKVTAQPGDMNQFLAGESVPTVSVSENSQPQNGHVDTTANGNVPSGHR